MRLFGDSFNASIHFLLGIVLLCSAMYAKGQVQQTTNTLAPIAPMLGSPIIHNYDSKTYKAHSQNWISVQDQRGIIYFGNS